MLKRAWWHDYRSAAIYMLTLSKEPAVSAFSEVMNKGTEEKAKAAVSLSPNGQIVADRINNWHKEFPLLKVLTYCIMPDHVHILVYVTKRSPKHLSAMVRVLKWSINQAMQIPGVFSEGYNDKIVYKTGQKDAFYRYILDNPRRYLARKLYPEFFSRVNTFNLNGLQVSLYGNIFLLNHPIKTVVRYSRKFTPEQLKKNNNIYEETMRSGGVLVSPFIHQEEKAVKAQALEDSTPIIQVALNGFPERFKPSGRDFELCAQGKLLIIAPIEHSTQKQPLDREAALRANAIAEAIAALPVTTI